MTEPQPRQPIRIWFDPQAAIEDAFARLIHEPWSQCGAATHTPAVDLYENAEAYLAVIEVPGVPPEAIEVRVEGDWLMIRGASQRLRVSRSAHAVRLERTHGGFSRSIRLSQPVDAERIETYVEHGALHARLPKRKSAATEPPPAPRRRPHD